MIMFLFIFICSSFLPSFYSFNYQTNDQWKYLKQNKTTYRSSYFGYSLAVYRTNLIIGAPRDHFPFDTVTRRGAVWQCPFNGEDQCQRIPFRRDGNVNVRVGTSFDNKTDQWLGASLAANHKTIIAGAPFLKHRIHDGKTLEFEIPGGAFFAKYDSSMNMIENTQIFSPSFLNWHSRNYNQEGYGEFGFQIALTENPERIIITAPGSYYFRGGIHSIPLLETNSIDTRHPFTSPHYKWRDAGWLRYPSNYSSNEYDDWCYRGYSIGIGNFNENDDQEILVSIPKLDNYRGAVEILNSNLEENSIRTLYGLQMGEYFGASLCVVDLNNDGLDDLIVGAPLYTVKKDGRILSDAGRVDIFYQTTQHNLIRKQSIEGTKEGGRLGHAIANLGDIDRDGFNDIAISIPFLHHAGSSGRVEIYRGSKSGLLLKQTQILEGNSLKTFGWSLQGQFDYDNNGYLDLAVGSLHSETVAIILSRPVLRLQTKLQHNLPSFPLNCTLNSDDDCFILTVCVELNYQFSKRDTLKYEIHLDKDKDHNDKRLLFRDSYKSSKIKQIKLINRDCHHYSLYIRTNIIDKLNGIRIQINYFLSSKFDPKIVSPILDPENSSFDYNIPMQKDCGSDDICTTKLNISTSNSPEIYKVGLTKQILLNINVTNDGENSYDTKCFIQFPSGIEYVSANSSSTMNIYCNLMKQSDRILVCQLGNPLLANRNISLQISVAVNNYSNIQSDPLVFTINVTSDNPNSDKLKSEIIIPISSSPQLTLIGGAKPEQIVYDTPEISFSRYTSSVPKPNDVEIIHAYTLYNNGPGDAEIIKMTFLWPLIPFHDFIEPNLLLNVFDNPIINRSLDSKLKLDHCFIENSFDRLFNSTSSFYCPQSICRKVICEIKQLNIGQNVLIELKATLKYDYFQKKSDRLKQFFIGSNGYAQVQKIPYNFSQFNVHEQEIFQFKLETQIPPTVDRLSQNWLWLIGISITAGVILLIILVGVLWCCGFFKRNRPKYSTSSSSQQSGQIPLQTDSDEQSSDEHDDVNMMIQNPIDSLPIVVPKNSTQFIQQQQQRNQFYY